MDYFSYIAKRTRSREAVYLKTEWERRKRRNGVTAAGLGECSGGKSEESNGGGGEVRDSGERVSEKPVLLDDVSEEDEVVEVREGVGERCSDSVGEKGSENRRSLKSGSLGEREVEEDGGVNSVSLERSPLKKRCVEKEKNVTEISVGKNESSAGETKRKSSKFNEESRFCMEERAPVDLGDQNECTVSDTAHTDDDDEYESESSKNDDDNDEDYQTENLYDSDSTEESTPSDGDGDSEDIDDADSDSLLESNHCNRHGDDQAANDTEVVDKGMPNQKNNGSSEVKINFFSELDVLVNPTNADGSSSVAQRTRSHTNSGSSKKKKKKTMQLGTFSEPICCDLETDSSTEGQSASSAADDGSGSYDDEDEEVNSNSNESDDEDDATKRRLSKNQGCKELKEKAQRRVVIDAKVEVSWKPKIELVKKAKSELEKLNTRKQVCSTKGGSLFNLFVNTIWEKGGVLQLEDDASEEKLPPVPLTFTFDEEPIPEKTDYEKQMDILWAEFDFALRSIELGSFSSSAIDNEDTNEPDVEEDPSILCCQGKHQLILDEQIGIKCSCCSFVKLEIKYILPPIDTHRSERIGRRNYLDEASISTWDGFDFQDATISQCSSLETKGTIWDKFPNIRQKMYPHQQDGFEFMWKNLAGSIDLDKLKHPANSEGVGGCVISHAPGTGKTLLTIVFLKTFMEVFEDCRPVIMAPSSMLLTWEEEFRKWKVDIPFHNLNAPDFSGMEDSYALKLVGGKLRRNKKRNTKWNRIVKLLSWSKGKSILGVGYSLFEKLAGEKFVKDKEGEKREVPHDKEGGDIRKILLDIPSLLVLDEGHTPRNERSRIWKALQNIKTERRIILSGTPFQNNFDELYNTLWLVRPKFADRISTTQKVCQKTSKLHCKKEARGKWVSLTSSIGKHADARLLEEIKSMIEPFVHVHRGSILQQNLPGLRDCVVVLHPPVLQKQILEGVLEIQNPLELEHAVSLVSVHPSLFSACNWPGIHKSLIDKISSKSFRLNPSNGVKTRFLMELIRLSETMNEKVLVFSQFIDPFFLIKDQLQAHFNWSEGMEVLQMDGKMAMQRRQFLINHFNDPASKARVLLASTKACREGINLVGASRIVLLDVVWNPSVERQAISRAYRIGQKKMVHTYHLITSGTMEADKYCRQVQKDRLSKLVFSSSHGDFLEQNSSSMVSDDKILEAMVGNDKLKDMFQKIICQ